MEPKIDYSISKKIKIICTLGPASDKEDILRQMIKAGMNVARINMSHGTIESQEAKITLIKKLNKELNTTVSILLDTKGPEIRLGQIKNDAAEIKMNSIVEITIDEIEGDETKFSVSYKDIITTVAIGQKIMIDDGKLTLEVTDINKKSIFAKALNTHTIKTKKAINLPGTTLKLPFISDYDRECIEWGLDQGIDYIAASFVSSSADIKSIREICNAKNKPNIQIMSKIESLRSIHNLNEIIRESDAIMLARGDLGVEIPFETVPFYQKLIVQKAKFFRKPVVVATQMLESMSDNPRPTRAEVSDVYFAGLMGCDATMLSGESASGNWPVTTVETMAKINRESEKNFNYMIAYENAYAYVETNNAEIAYAVAKISNEERFPFIISITKTGGITKALSQYRTQSIILSISSDKKLERYFGAWYGVYTFTHPKANVLYENDKLLLEVAKNFNLAKNTSVIVCTSKEYRIWTYK